MHDIPNSRYMCFCVRTILNVNTSTCVMVRTILRSSFILYYAAYFQYSAQVSVLANENRREFEIYTVHPYGCSFVL